MPLVHLTKPVFYSMMVPFENGHSRVDDINKCEVLRLLNLHIFLELSSIYPQLSKWL